MNDAAETGANNDYEQVFYSASDGLRLAARDYGRGRPGTENHAPVVCLAGMMRNSADFHDLALILSKSEAAPRRVICFDYRGRGLSDRDKDKSNYSIQVETDDLLAGCAALSIHHAAIIGTSRGALVIHVLAAMRPGIMSSAILNDAGPAIEGTGLAQIMAYHDRLKQPSSLSDVAETMKGLQGTAFSALSNQDWRDLAEGSFEERKGKVVPRFDRALVDMLHDIDLNVPLPTLWPQFDGLRNIPLMTIRGENSSLLTQETVEEMAQRNPDMEVHIAKGQGHAPLLHVGELPRAIAAFLRKAEKK
ncbi:alpha/beta fold hydrolase [Hoeflea prorocentri]|uniref:Alpha/beta hydrolase n=1 Tax=Hoeflea prorocentri TaxID=1922333 RepID=A0A9X3UHG0_9HYPH|nr:alpha/beta hydrolase [Hoeflea prorocentri]MCY6381468.1 alpha/beta hydrolase [Hoeflea prorocentri]MDA5399268.1 alpha/beta hydrolase [Hoeflea prorocentri]